MYNEKVTKMPVTIQEWQCKIISFQLDYRSVIHIVYNS